METLVDNVTAAGLVSPMVWPDGTPWRMDTLIQPDDTVSDNCHMSEQGKQKQVATLEAWLATLGE